MFPRFPPFKLIRSKRSFCRPCCVSLALAHEGSLSERFTAMTIDDIGERRFRGKDSVFEKNITRFNSAAGWYTAPSQESARRQSLVRMDKRLPLILLLATISAISQQT